MWGGGGGLRWKPFGERDMRAERSGSEADLLLFGVEWVGCSVVVTWDSVEDVITVLFFDADVVSTSSDGMASFPVEVIVWES